MVSSVASFLYTLWTGICSLEVLDFGFSFGAFFVAVMLADLSVWLVGRAMGNRRSNRE